jgi:hypothetical protein
MALATAGLAVGLSLFVLKLILDYSVVDMSKKNETLLTSNKRRIVVRDTIYYGEREMFYDSKDSKVLPDNLVIYIYGVR